MGIPQDERGPVLTLAGRLQSTPALAALVGPPGEYRPFIVDGGFLYHQRVFAVEERLAQALRRRLEGPPPALSPADLERALAAAADIHGTSLSDEQRAAVTAALARPLAVITGGPGTGKTSVIVALLRAAAALGIDAADVALAAPTGKAAHRINETLAAHPVGAGAPSAETLHRLLGYRASTAASPAAGASGASGEFRHHRNHRLPHRLVIVDESSMVDLGMMERLAGAIRDDARLVLLGDAHQLPSVDAGAVFRDLATAPWAVTLTRSYRMDPATGAGRSILAAAEAIRTDRAADLAVPQRRRAAELTFEGIEQLVGGTLEDFFARWMAHASSRSGDQARLSRRVYHFDASGPAAGDAPDLAALYAHQHDQRILCVTRGAARPTGADAVNATLHRRAVAHHHQSTGGFAVGEPLIMLRNDYQRGLFNGDLGICAQVVFGDGAPIAAAETADDSSAATLAAVFARGDSFVAFPLSHLAPDLALAYALTVHRAQGSEVDALALILPDEDLPLLSRELLYTALTRARRSAVIVGAPRILGQGVARQIHRSSGLAERLFHSPNL
jgi:exodeoxyribonuclease V alpha subunit